MLRLIDGKQLAQQRRDEIKKTVETLKQQGIVPGLAVILVGDDSASQVYVRNKEKACQEVGFYSEVHRLPESTTQEQLLQLIDRLNKDSKIHGLLVQLPVPAHIDEKAVIHAISPLKDVDGFLPENMGALLIGEPGAEPCTPKRLSGFNQTDWDFHCRQKSSCDRAQQYCRQADGHYAAAGACHRYHLPFKNQKSERRITGSRYYCGGNWESQFYYRRYGQRRRSGD